MKGRPPALQGLYLLNDLQFAVVGRCIASLQSGREIKRWLREECGYCPGSGKSAEYHLLKGFEEQGLIRGYVVLNETAYKATKKGFDLWCATYDYREQASEYWALTRNGHYSAADFSNEATPAKKPARERPPTEYERKLIIANSPSAFRDLYCFSLNAKVRLTDILNARIESINWKAKTLQLEAEATDGRKIKNRHLGLSEDAVADLRRVAGERKTGPIFLNNHGNPWNVAAVSAFFRAIKRRCKIPREVMLSGRGGKIGEKMNM